jgi:hypothetical protein
LSDRGEEGGGDVVVEQERGAVQNCLVPWRDRVERSWIEGSHVRRLTLLEYLHTAA